MDSVPGPIFWHFWALLLPRKLVFMHERIPPEEGECLQASHSNLTMCWVGVQLSSGTKLLCLSLYVVPQPYYGCAS